MDSLIIEIISEYRWANLIKKVNQEYHQTYRIYYPGMCLGYSVLECRLECRLCGFGYNYRWLSGGGVVFYNWINGHQHYPFHQRRGLLTALSKNY